MNKERLRKLKVKALKNPPKELSKILLPKRKKQKGEISSNELLLQIRYGN